MASDHIHDPISENLGAGLRVSRYFHALLWTTRLLIFLEDNKMNIDKKENKLKKFVKDHEVEFTVVGYGIACLAVGVGIGYACNWKPKGIAYIHSKSTGEEDLAALIDLCACVNKGTRATVVSTPPAGKAVTAAEYLGDGIDRVLQFGVQPDDVIDNVIINIAKKA